MRYERREGLVSVMADCHWGHQITSQRTALHSIPNSAYWSSDNAPGVAFCSVENTPITYAAEDDLSCSRVSMKPDRVIGLRAPPDISQSDALFPAKGRGSLMLPFLVMEAKREKAAPGFQSILYQTAFPVRRFLKAQHDIESRDAASEPCLVWLLAYQGEQWRLHAGTLQGDRTVSDPRRSKRTIANFSENL
jgi:hypothetical protein